MTTWHWPTPAAGTRAWQQLAAMAADGQYLLHGSQTADLQLLEPRAPVDHSLDDYSKRTAVFATEDPTWAIAYAVRASDCPQFLNACFYPGDRPGTPAQRRLFYSYGRRLDGTVPVSPGVVYVLRASSFEGTGARVGDSRLHAASAGVWSMINSYSTGVNRPRRTCRRRRW